MIFFMEQKLSKEAIIHAAFAYLKENPDLSQLTMRKLAKELSVQAPALYWYFTNKQELLQAMAETMENELPDAPAGPWQEQLQSFMANYYDLYLQYPCGAELEIHTIPSYPSRLLHLEQMITILIEAGFSPAQSNQTVQALYHLLLGHLLDRQQEDRLRAKIITGDEKLQAHVSTMRNYVVENQLKGIAEGIQQRKQIDERQVFLESIAIYLAGLNQRIPPLK
jgi:AcrR family transcriptional regulator